MKASLMRVATEYGNVDYGDFSGTKLGRYGRITPSLRKRWARIQAAAEELVSEGKLTPGSRGWDLVK